MFLPSLGERLRVRVIHDAHLVHHGIPERGAPLADREVAVVHVRPNGKGRSKRSSKLRRTSMSVYR